MSKTLYISVVLSTYNEETYIEKSVRSILNQSYPYFELIVVNDGSTDNTLNILKSIVDERLIILDKENSGLPDSLNYGIQRAKYDWIARMDGDDIAEPTRFADQIEAIHDGLGVIGGQYRAIDSEGKYISNNLSTKPLTSFRCKLELILGRSPFAHPTVLIRKDLIKEFGGYDTNFKAAQDVELWMRLAPSTNMINLDKQVLNYRFHNNNISSKRKDLQRKLTFIGFMKYALSIRRPLSPSEFENFEDFLNKKGLITKNVILFDRSHSLGGIQRLIGISLYYFWRFLLLIKYRTLSKYYVKSILIK